MRWLWTLAFGFAVFSFSAGLALADKRVALVIGNGAYVQVPTLPNPRNDAADVAAALNRIGFETVLATDLSQVGMQEAEIRFARAARTADVALFYYSGHAIQFSGVNYLVPVDAQLRDEPDLRRLARADQILADLQQAKTLRILVLDSCRDNPLAEALKRSVGPTRGISIAPGLAKMESADGTIITYSTQAGRTAIDGNGRNSPFTGAFIKHVEDKDDVATVFHRVGADVYQATAGSQVPELSISYFGEYYLNGKSTIVSTQIPQSTPTPVDPCIAANEQLKQAQLIGGIGAVRDHVARFPNCPPLQGLAKSKVVALSAPYGETQQTLDPTRFDGTWLGTKTCPPTSEGTLADKMQFIGEVRNGMFHGQYGEVGKPDSQTFDGSIRADGSALISVQVVEKSESSASNPTAVSIATAKFQESKASGSLDSNHAICALDFAKIAERPPADRPMSSLK